MADDLALELTLDGVTYQMRPGDFTGQDDLEIFRAVGVTVMDIFAGKFTLFTVAALLWRYRVNNGEPKLKFDEVNRSMTFDALETVTDEPESSDPEG